MELNKFDFQPDNRFDFQPDEQDLNNKFDFQADEVETPVLKGKVEYNHIHNNTFLTPEQKVQKIKEISNNEQEK